jgi:hypothetical protein
MLVQYIGPVLVDIYDENFSAASSRQMGRSAVSNGTQAFLPESASLLRKTRRYRNVLGQIVSDRGGEDLLSEAQKQLCRRAVTMSLQCEHWDAAAAAGQEVDWDLYSRTTNTLRRTLEPLGLQRVPRQVDDGSDILMRAHEVSK